MSGDWRDEVQLRLEDFIDTFVVRGARQIEVYDAIRRELEVLRAAYDRDRDPAEDDAVEEPSNNWPESQT
ncbi:hypothetical protein [Rhizobium sp. BK376]|uniref:hypothetical protein n=1 Tax=Rhizobium sp. BK376 TaxID=2512149 RepID=UPI0010442EDD|nr:hypothetical protein [Rhizobium sp. BK376]TCR65953.1 hypothetical protein EV561_1553 [Rhizobium sp. BK376]